MSIRGKVQVHSRSRNLSNVVYTAKLASHASGLMFELLCDRDGGLNQPLDVTCKPLHRPGHSG